MLSHLTTHPCPAARLLQAATPAGTAAASGHAPHRDASLWHHGQVRVGAGMQAHGTVAQATCVLPAAERAPHAPSALALRFHRNRLMVLAEAAQCTPDALVAAEPWDQQKNARQLMRSLAACSKGCDDEACV